MTKIDELLIADAVDHQVKEAERQGYPQGAENYRRAWQQLKLLITTTANVRKAQRVYFRTRTTEALEEAKRLEAQLDEMLKEYSTEHKQPELFKG